MGGLNSKLEIEPGSPVIRFTTGGEVLKNDIGNVLLDFDPVFSDVITIPNHMVSFRMGQTFSRTRLNAPNVPVRSSGRKTRNYFGILPEEVTRLKVNAIPFVNRN